MVSKGFHWRQSRDVRVLVPDFFDALDLRGGYSTRTSALGRDLDCDFRGGKDRSEILRNRRLIAAVMKVAPSALVVAEQVHGDSVATVAAKEAGCGAASHESAVPATDALVTADASLSLAGLAADCAILLLADQGHRAIACVHSGRRGAVLDIAAATVAAIGPLGPSPGDLFVSIGPSICLSCYEVGPQVASEFEQGFPWAHEFLKISLGRAHLDLSGVIRRQLVEAGVRDDRVFDAGLCTVCRNDFFYSYRKERESAGRFVGVVSLAPPAALTSEDHK